jgi:hypothetical protein
VGAAPVSRARRRPRPGRRRRGIQPASLRPGDPRKQRQPAPSAPLAGGYCPLTHRPQCVGGCVQVGQGELWRHRARSSSCWGIPIETEAGTKCGALLLPAGSVLTSATPLPGDLATTLRAPSTCSSRPDEISATYRAEGSLMAFENLAAPQGAAGPTNCFATSRRAW